VTKPKRNLLLLALAALLAAAAPACGSSSDDGDGGAAGSGGDGGPDTGDEICDNGEDDDGDEAVDCEDPNCAAFAACQTECTEQVPACESDTRGRIDRVCIAGSCEPAGQISETGTLLRGGVRVVNQLPESLQTQASQNRSFLVELVHPVRPDGSMASCDALLDDARAGGPIAGYNLVGRSVGSVTATSGQENIPAPAFEMPVPEPGAGWLLLTRLYGALDNGQPAGELMALGCKAGVVIPAGEFVDDDAHRVTVQMQPVCSPSDPNSCPEPLTCKFGALVCRDERCTDCTGAAVICRDVDGDPMCLKRCDPDKLDTAPCPANHRCDTTPGFSPACIPVQ